MITFKKLQLVKEILLDYSYHKEHKLIAVYLCKQQTLLVNPKAIQQINFTENLDHAGNTTMLFIIEESKETIFKFYTKSCESIMELSGFLLGTAVV